MNQIRFSVLFQVFFHPLRALFCDPVFMKRANDSVSDLTHHESSGDRIRMVNIEPPKNDHKHDHKFVVTEGMVNSLFGNMEAIVERHRALLTSLRKAVEEWSPVQTIGNIFIELVNNFSRS